MGYKLAGYHHLGGVELDPSIAAIYKQNHHPEYLYIEDIRDFNKRTDLPAELYQLDILDGSPPCSTFSTAGDREKAWGKEKRFAEGQKMQQLDDLVFVYCDTIAKLKPKVCWLENVSGLVKGNAKVYAKNIVRRLQEIGYNVQVFLLNGATMGVPQVRERSFFIGLRKDFHLPKLVLDFNEAPIPFKEIKDGTGRPIDTEDSIKIWKLRKPTDNSFCDTTQREFGETRRFNVKYIHDDHILKTLNATTNHALYSQPNWLSIPEMLKGSTFPIDYQAPENKVMFLTGMSVAPLMSAQISYQIYKQWLSKINK
jgi:DNA (cytosine-5)-methyltransferase 1